MEARRLWEAVWSGQVGGGGSFGPGMMRGDGSSWRGVFPGFPLIGAQVLL